MIRVYIGGTMGQSLDVHPVLHGNKRIGWTRRTIGY